MINLLACMTCQTENKCGTCWVLVPAWHVGETENEHLWLTMALPQPSAAHTSDHTLLLEVLDVYNLHDFTHISKLLGPLMFQ